MPEENEKREIEHIAGNKPDDGKEYLHTAIGFGRKPSEKYEVYWLLPVTDIKDELKSLSDECQERYDCDLVSLIEFGVRQLTTRPDYKTVGFTEDGELKPQGHENMQAMADNYKVGARAVGTSVKAKAKDLDAVMATAEASSVEELKAKLAKMKELEEKGLI